MLKHADDLIAVAEALKQGEVSAEEVHIHLGPRLECASETEVQRILNDLEVAVHTLPEPSRQARILEILAEAAALVASRRRWPPG